MSVVIPSTALQDAVALITSSLGTDGGEELEALVAEFRVKDGADDLLLAVVALCRSLCLATSKVINVLDNHLSDDEAAELSEAELLPVALDVVRQYAVSAARNADREPDEL